MSLINAHFFSNFLQKHVQMNVILPSVGNPPYPTYYLLHGLSDDYSVWLRRTSIERYVENLPLVVVMPDGFRGYYTDNHEGPAYGRYMIEEVIGFVEKTFQVKNDRESRCVGGLSMGGYGAMRLAFSRPDLFISANSHSGAMHCGHDDPRIKTDAEFRRIFGPMPQGTDHDLYALVSRCKKAKTLPQLYFDCGTEDFLLQANRDFIKFLKAENIPHEYREFPGAHAWDYWDRHVSEAIAFHCKALGIS